MTDARGRRGRTGGRAELVSPLGSVEGWAVRADASAPQEEESQERRHKRVELERLRRRNSRPAAVEVDGGWKPENNKNAFSRKTRMQAFSIPGQNATVRGVHSSEEVARLSPRARLARLLLPCSRLHGAWGRTLWPYEQNVREQAAEIGLKNRRTNTRTHLPHNLCRVESQP